MASVRRRNALHVEHIRAHYPFFLWMHATTRLYLEANGNYQTLGHPPGAQISGIVQNLYQWRHQPLYENHNQPFHENPRKARPHQEAYIARRRELTEGYTLYPPAIPYTQATVFSEDVIEIPPPVRLRQTRAEREQSVLSFVADFEAVHSQHLTNDNTPQTVTNLTTPNGAYYHSITKHGLSGPWIYFYVHRFSANAFDRTRFPTKMDRRQIIQELAVIYPKAMMHYQPYQTEEVGDWYVMNYTRGRLA